MIVAVPVTKAHRIAAHFSKAPAFAVYNEQGQLIQTLDNATDGGCGQKKRLAGELKKLGVSRLVLRKVGQRSLERLLAAGISVDQVRQRSTIAEVLSGQISTQPLTDAAQGHLGKSGREGCGGGCGCSGKKTMRPLAGFASTAQTHDKGLPKISLVSQNR